MVEWKPLNKIVKSISTGLNPRQNFILNEEDASLYYVTVKEITTNKVIFSNSTDRITENAKQIINNRSKLSKGDILFSGIGTIGKVAYVDIPTSNWDCSESVFLIKPNELETKGKYLAYILSSDIAKNQYERGAAGAIMKGVRKATLESLLIPIPSLSEQTRIVGILDTFTSAIDNLKEQIAQRRKQYEHYRDQLLDLEGREGVVMKNLGDVCTIKNGYTPSTKNPDFWNNGTLPWFTLEDIRKNGRILSDAIKHITPLGVKKGGLFPKQSIIVSTTATIGEYALIETDFLCNQQITCLSIKEVYKDFLLSKYLYYLSDGIGKWCQRNVNGGGSLLIVSTSKINLLPIPIPSIDEQSRIVSILDTFEAGIANLAAQLELREKQYEYYRNKLLTFE